MGKYIIEKKNKSCEWLAWVAIALMVINVYHTTLVRMFFSFFSTEFIMVLIAVSTILLIVYFFLNNKLHFRTFYLSETDVLMLLATAIIIITSGADFENIKYLIRFSVLFILIVLMKYDEKMIKILLVSLLAASMIHLLATLFLYFDNKFYFEYVYPTFERVDRNRLYYWNLVNGYATGLAEHFSLNGMYISISLISVSSLVYVRKKKSTGFKFLCFTLSVIAFITIFLTGKRAVLIFSFFSLLLTFLIYNRYSPLYKAGIVLAVLLGLLILLMIAYQYIPGIEIWVERFKGAFDDNTDISDGRFALYSLAWLYFLKNPIFGIGWRQFSVNVANYYNQDSYLRDAHNVFLQLLCETGIVGFLIFMALFSVALYIIVKTIKTYKKGLIQLSEWENIGLVFSLTAQIFFLCYCLTGNPLYDISTLYFYMFAVGISSGIYFRKVTLPKMTAKREKISSRYIR